MRAFACLLLALAACVTAPTTFEASFLRPEYRDRRYKTVAVLSLSDDPGLRRAFGESMVGYLGPWTQRAMKGGDLLPRTAYDRNGDGRIDVDVDKEAVRTRIREAGFDAILTAHYEPREELEVRTGALPEHTWGSETFAGHWASESEKAHTGAPPSEVLIETELYDAETGRVVWTGHSRTVLAGSVGTLSESYASAVVEELVKNGLIGKR